jgi:hypothetical protein
MSCNTTSKKAYLMLPSHYINQLQKDGMRDKSRAFMEYFFDMEKSTIKTFQFYADNWNISNNMAESWIKDFMIEIDLFYSHHLIHNQEYYKTTIGFDNE